VGVLGVVVGCLVAERTEVAHKFASSRNVFHEHDPWNELELGKWQTRAALSAATEALDRAAYEYGQLRQTVHLYGDQTEDASEIAKRGETRGWNNREDGQ
jgi:hypothetical protein